jgi:hypothetical protein
MLNAIKNALKGKSMTLNLNALAVVLFILDMVSGTDIIKNNPDYAVIVTAVMNILLRFKTKEPVSKKR